MKKKKKRKYRMVHDLCADTVGILADYTPCQRVTRELIEDLHTLRCNPKVPLRHFLDMLEEMTR